MTPVKIPRPISGGLILSYKCTAECRHCMYACSPKWKGDWISQKDLEEILARLSGKVIPAPRGSYTASLNYGLHFTGGEPFLNFELLLKAVEIANEMRIPSTFVETNCYWCSSDKITRERLKVLKDKGLKGILISVNPYYAEYVPFERSQRCVRTSIDVFGENVMIYQLEYYHRFRQLGITKRINVEDYLRRAKKEVLAENVELFLMGRAVRELREYYPAYPADIFFDEPCRPPFLRDWHNHFDNYGNFLPGYCGGISLGRWQELDSLINEGIELERYPVLGFLIVGDMRGLFQFAKDYGYREPREGYVSKCDLCLELRKYLNSVKDFDELNPKEFYLHVE